MNTSIPDYYLIKYHEKTCFEGIYVFFIWMQTQTVQSHSRLTTYSRTC